MGQNSCIEWTDHTFNPWTGCTRVSPGCDHCYAAALARRAPASFGSWEPGAPRKRTSSANWMLPLRWNRAAEAAGTRAKVFCASLADVFDNQVPEDWRADLFDLIQHTPALDWLLLTKRPQNIAKMIPQPATGWSNPGWPWSNVWLGTTVENQHEADRRIPHLLAVPAHRRFLSCEPLLGPVDLMLRLPSHGDWDVLTGKEYWAGASIYADSVNALQRRTARIDWVIAGGESGHGARSAHTDWFRSLRDQSATAAVPFFFKQWGVHHPHGQALADGSINALGNPDDARWGTIAGCTTWRVEKKRAGAMLDGREHREVPSATPSLAPSEALPR